MIKETLKNILLVAGLVASIWLMGVIFQAQDDAARERAINKCGINNIVEKRTSQGDLYFTCLVEK